MYDERYYKKHQPGSYNSAIIILKYLMSFVNISSVIDFGCGMGTWCQAARESGISDITYCKVNQKQYYICVIIDLFSRKVLSCEISGTMSSSIVSAAFLEAYIKRGQPQNLVFHSDQGTQYRSDTFKKRLMELNVSQSFSKPGCPYDNAVAESFFASLKKEEIYRTDYERIGDLRKAVEQYIEFFNKERPHLSLGYKTPEQVEREYDDGRAM